MSVLSTVAFAALVGGACMVCWRALEAARTPTRNPDEVVVRDLKVAFLACATFAMLLLALSVSSFAR